MLSWIGNLISIVRALIGLYGAFKEAQEARARAEQEKRKQDRDKAIDDSKKAVTNEEIWKSQDDIVNNQSKP